MKTAKLFKIGNSQAVRLPKEFRFEGSEVGISKFGKTIILFPKSDAEKIFFDSLGNFTDDVFTSIEEARREDILDAPREEL